MQPLGADQPTMSHIRAIDIPFNMRYGSLIYPKRLQSDGPQCRGLLVEAGTPRSNAEIRYFPPAINCGCLLEKFNFLHPNIAQDLLFQMRYGSLICSKK